MTDPTSGLLHANRERGAMTFSGWAMLLIALVALFALVGSALSNAGGNGPLWLIGGTPVLVVLFILILRGFYILQPNQAVAILLFGSYRGTDRATGLRWTWPWMSRARISVRANNAISEKLKVNDLRGNPIEIAAQLVWRVTDTAQALFDIDDYRAFVGVQIEAGVRAIGSRYAYDGDEAEVTLRGHHDEVNNALRDELRARLAIAGITVDECGLTHLAYAPEIAGAMLRRQQAEAVVAARAKLVEGAVSMVEMALEQLSARDVVELDDERRAAMVSNLMVVLCGERETQPIVNTGTLYQ
ncbi:SPFH domain-containing protein [Sphingomonas crocodyli]|uniref:SPFH domain-containing protein n=1 Tax=Sphingomonas crocodyli TaxID=1979270 RepID=A0A437M4C4_9SPHN|nr:SPFH domain-containing protein [Sphingomonas crocodyli]RVT92413.1 SPFH domain-containing protein [Sphingomonas crocodyli]